MKIMVATKLTQGQRTSDHCSAGEGEVVTFVSVECDRERVDGKCGCRRSMVSVETSQATTTMRIEDMDIDHDQLRNLLKGKLISGGWDKSLTDEDLNRIVESNVGELIRLANAFPVGAIIEKRGDTLQVREIE